MSRFRIVEAALSREFAKPYRPGAADCLFMGFAVVDDLTGSNFVRKFARTYHTIPGAHRAMRRRGFTSLTGFLACEFGQQPKGGAEARFGDIVVIRGADGIEHVGVCLGVRFATKTENGRIDYGLSDIVAAFHIG